jgi:hypothetical protein
MAEYFGDSIGDAARAEERQLERFINLGLANREYAARERARADAINAQNAANAMAADRLGLSLSENNRINRYNMSRDAEDRALALEDRDYGRRQDMIDTLLGLDEAEKNRKLQRELNTLRNDNYIQRLQQAEDQRLYGDIAKRIATEEIRDIPSLQDAEGGRLASEDWVDLKTRLGQHQQRLMQEASMGPELAAREATLALRGDPSWTGAGDNAELKRAALDQVMRRLGESRVFSGKLLPDYNAGDFKPNLGYKYSGPRDAINWYQPGGPTPEPSAAAVATTPTPVADPGLMGRLGNFVGRISRGVGQGVGSMSRRMGVVDGPQEPVAAEADVVVPPPPPLNQDPLEQQKLAEIRALRRAGMDKFQAALIVEAKYRNRPSGPVRTY